MDICIKVVCVYHGNTQDQDIDAYIDLDVHGECMYMCRHDNAHYVCVLPHMCTLCMSAFVCDPHILKATMISANFIKYISVCERLIYHV